MTLAAIRVEPRRDRHSEGPSARSRLKALLALLAVSVGLPLALAGTPADAAGPQARAEMMANDGSVLGTVTLTEAPQGVLLDIDLSGVPAGFHAIHLHRIGDCSDNGFKAAGGHINPYGRLHGLLNPQGPDNGDLPNVYAHDDGTVRAQLFTQLASLQGPYRPAILDYDGAAVVMHENPDDHQAQPIGGAGARIGCGVIKLVE